MNVSAMIATSSINGPVLDGDIISQETERDLTERWSECPVPIIQRRWEHERLLDLYQARAPKRVLEVGSGYGGTLYYWLQKGAPDSIVVAVDSYSTNEWYGPDKDNRKLYPAWIPENVHLRVLKGDCSDEETLKRAANYGPFDWVFIDAGHKTWETLRDWKNYKQMVAPGGIMAFHDIVSYYKDETTGEVLCDVPSAWAQIRAEGYVTQELIAMPYHKWYTSNGHEDWSGIGIVYFP